MVMGVILTIRNGERAGECHEIDAPGELVIGRAATCDVSLSGNDPALLTVSRRHCLLTFDPPHARVRDLDSRNGTCLNGVQIGRAEDRHLSPDLLDTPRRTFDLMDGDELRVGPTVLQVAIRATQNEPAELDELVCAGL